jgi:hypothetical protein
MFGILTMGASDKMFGTEVGTTDSFFSHCELARFDAEKKILKCTLGTDIRTSYKDPWHLHEGIR